jgi:aldehyde:ferredoxin oxidoreductase
MFGYSGRILEIDLSNGDIHEFPLSIDLAEMFIGGLGLNTRLILNYLKPGVNPLSDGNPIVLGVGPLVGVVGAVKAMATTKLPATGTIATCSGGGGLADAMKRAGYDHIVVKGASDKPVYIEVSDEDVRINDASSLWGLDAYETTYRLKRKHYGSSVLSIGEAGEKLISWSICLIDNISHLGRGGLAAVMGVKKLKAVVVYGGYKVKLANPEGVKSVLSRVIDRIKRYSQFLKGIAKYGMMVGIENWANSRMLVYNNYRSIHTKLRNGFLDEYLKIKVRSIGCPRCPGPCKGVFKINGLEKPLPEPLNIAIAFTLRLNDCSLSSGVKLLYEATRHGIDCLNLTPFLEFLVETYESNKLSIEDIGFKPELNVKSMEKLVEYMLKCEGICSYIRMNGWRGLFERFGLELEKYAPNCRGLSIIFDPRSNFGAESFGHVTNPRGHEGPVQLTVISGRDEDSIRKYLLRIGCSEDDVNKVFKNGLFNIALYTRHVEDWLYILNSLGLCRRESIALLYDIDTCAELYTHTTGIRIQPKDLKIAADRIHTLERLINCREGVGRDKYPDRWLEPLTLNDQEIYLMDYFKRVVISKEDLEDFINQYYHERGWSIVDGSPTMEKIMELKLADLKFNNARYI